MDETAPAGDGSDARWAVPGAHGTPAEALARIGVLCSGTPDLFAAMLAVLGTHQSVSREILALAIRQFRPDTADLTREDVVSLLTAILNGGRQGFDAVLRSRRKGDRASRQSALPWGRES